MKHSIKVGLNFGMMSGIITTLGMIVGLNAGTQSKTVVLGGIILIAVSDAFSDALGIHISEESENVHSHLEIWVSTIATFVSKFLFSIMFVVPILCFSLKTAVLVSIFMGCSFITMLSWYLAKKQKISAWGVILEHLLVASLVILLTHNIGDWVSRNF